MITLKVYDNPQSEGTGKLLAELLEEKGIRSTESERVADGLVSYGVALETSKPALNARAATFNKFRELEMLQAAGIRTVPFSYTASRLEFPLLARNLVHTGGVDIRLFRSQAALASAEAFGYLTQVIPSSTEYRIWVFRERLLAIYEKVLAHAEKNIRFGRNYANGYVFNEVPLTIRLQTAAEAAINSVRAVGYDWGAVDVLRGEDGRPYVLEVNSAPTQRGRRRGIVGLANEVVKWAKEEIHA